MIKVKHVFPRMVLALALPCLGMNDGTESQIPQALKESLSALFFPVVDAAQQQPQTHEWIPEFYVKGNWVHERKVRKILEEAKINFSDKKVLDVGCGSGNLSFSIAE